MNVYLDNAATTKLSDAMKEYLVSVLDLWGNPSSLHSVGEPAKRIVSDARHSVAKFIRADPDAVYFTPSGSAGNTLAIKGMTSENPQENQYEVFYSPTAHKSMLNACKSCIYHTSLKVNHAGQINVSYLDHVLTRHNVLKPLVCIEAANSEIGTVNDVVKIGSVVHKHNGAFIVDATGYVPAYRMDTGAWENYVDIVTFSGHKLHALKGTGVLWKRKSIELKPLIYGSQQDGIIAGTENVLGIASLGKAAADYDYSSVSPAGRDYVYDYILRHIPHSRLVGPSIASGRRLPHNLYLCFQGVEAESLVLLLDMNHIQVSTGSACNSGSLYASAALSAIGMTEPDIHSCIRLSFSGKETKDELDYVCIKLEECISALRGFI